MREHKIISIADEIYEQLEHDILSGTYARGEILSELRLSNELGVSRTPVREAIRRLEQEKILEEAGRGVVVVGISREDMMDMYDIRLNLEGVAVGRAAERITDEELKEMKDTVDLQRFYLNREGSDSSEQIRSLDSRFHDLLYRSSGSKAFYDVLWPLHKKITKYRTASVRRQGRAAQSVQEHEAIYLALAARDPERAYEAVMHHCVMARDSMAEMEL